MSFESGIESLQIIRARLIVIFLVLNASAVLHRGSMLASQPAALGLIPSVPEIFSDEKLSMLLRLINGAV